MAVEEIKIINKTFTEREPKQELIRKKEDDGKKAIIMKIRVVI